MSKVATRKRLTTDEKIKLLDKTKKLFGKNGERWTTGRYFQDEKGHGIDPSWLNGEQPAKFCLVGGLEQAAYELGFTAERQNEDRFGPLTSLHDLVTSKTHDEWPEENWESLEDFNDENDHGFEGVRSLLNERLKQLRAMKRKMAKK